MATLYLDRKGAALDIDAGTLTVRLGGELATRIPLVPLERVVLRGDALLSTRVLAELWRHDVGLLLLSGRPTMSRCGWRNTGGRATRRPAAKRRAISPAPSSPGRRACWAAPSRCGPTAASR